MRIPLMFAFVAALSLPAFSSDLVLKKSKHQDAGKKMGKDVPAEDSTSIQWIGKDRMRIEEGDDVTIVRNDLKKIYHFDTKSKLYQSIDLPLDIKKYIPAEQLKMLEPFMAQFKVTIAPTTETKKIKDWNATKFVMTITPPGGGTMSQNIWVTKDIAVDRAQYFDLQTSYLNLMMGGLAGGALATEWKQVDGIPVLIEHTEKALNQFTWTEEVTTVETKDAPEGTYDLPKDFTEVPYDPLNSDPLGKSKRGKGRSEAPASPPPAEKPKERPPAPQPK